MSEFSCETGRISGFYCSSDFMSFMFSITFGDHFVLISTLCLIIKKCVDPHPLAISCPAYIYFLNLSISCIRPLLGAARWHPSKPDRGAASAQRNPQETQRVHAGGDRRLPQAVDAVCTNSGATHKSPSAGLVDWLIVLFSWFHSHSLLGLYQS